MELSTDDLLLQVAHSPSCLSISLAIWIRWSDRNFAPDRVAAGWILGLNECHYWAGLIAG